MRTIALILVHVGHQLERVSCISGGHPALTPSLQFGAREQLSMPAQQGLQRVLEALAVRLLVAPYFHLVGQPGNSSVAAIAARAGDENHPRELAEVLKT